MSGDEEKKLPDNIRVKAYSRGYMLPRDSDNGKVLSAYSESMVEDAILNSTNFDIDTYAQEKVEIMRSTGALDPTADFNVQLEDERKRLGDMPTYKVLREAGIKVEITSSDFFADPSHKSNYIKNTNVVGVAEGSDYRIRHANTNLQFEYQVDPTNPYASAAKTATGQVDMKTLGDHLTSRANYTSFDKNGNPRQVGDPYMKKGELIIPGMITSGNLRAVNVDLAKVEHGFREVWAVTGDVTVVDTRQPPEVEKSAEMLVGTKLTYDTNEIDIDKVDASGQRIQDFANAQSVADEIKTQIDAGVRPEDITLVSIGGTSQAGTDKWNNQLGDGRAKNGVDEVLARLPENVRAGINVKQANMSEIGASGPEYADIGADRAAYIGAFTGTVDESTMLNMIDEMSDNRLTQVAQAKGITVQEMLKTGSVPTQEQMAEKVNNGREKVDGPDGLKADVTMVDHDAYKRVSGMDDARMEEALAMAQAAQQAKEDKGEGRGM